MARTKNRSKRKGKTGDSEASPASRTQITKGKKRSLAAQAGSKAASGGSGSQQPPAKRRKPNSKDDYDQPSTVGAESLREFVPFSSLQDLPFAQGDLESTMSGSSFGNNRLRSGFNPRRMQRSASHAGTPSDSESPIAPIYNLDTEDEDGGITLNVQGNGSSPIVISDDEDDDNGDEEDQSDLEEGEERESAPQPVGRKEAIVRLDSAKAPPADTMGDASFVIDPTPSLPQVYLKDLNPDQLEEQIKYAFWHLPRDQIDLSRPARCLHCQAEGHVDERCPQKTCSNCGAFGQHNSELCPQVRRCDRCRERGHAHCSGMRNTTIPCDLCSTAGHAENECPLRHYSNTAVPSSEPMRLWITCCACASKSHTVGDCPNLKSSHAVRWSLRSFDPEQIVNLSIQGSAGKLERDAQNRGMRPEGLKIKGRASQHQADARRRDSSGSDDMENFLSHPPRARDERRRPPQSHISDGWRPGDSGRYDRYAPPNNSDTYRPPRNKFYSTDSFGRPRSRSPPRFDYRRDSSPAGSYNSYRPGDRPPSRRSSPPRWGEESGGRQRPAPGVSIQLPTRKGSNTSLKGNSAAPTARLPARPPAQNAGRGRGGKNRGRK